MKHGLMTGQTHYGITPKLAVLAACAATLSGCSQGTVPPPAGTGIAVLSCRDSAGQQAADPAARPANGVESAALNGDTNTYDTLPAWKSREGRRYLVWKVFLAVAPGTRPYRIITVTRPASARLFYASPARWGAASAAKVIAAPPQRIRLASCSSREYTGYTGGILIPHPACVTLSITGPATESATVTVPILTARC